MQGIDLNNQLANMIPRWRNEARAARVPVAGYREQMAAALARISRDVAARLEELARSRGIGSARSTPALEADYQRMRSLIEEDGAARTASEKFKYQQMIDRAENRARTLDYRARVAEEQGLLYVNSGDPEDNRMLMLEHGDLLRQAYAQHRVTYEGPDIWQEAYVTPGQAV